MPKVTRKKQRERLRKNFLDGVARRPHTHSRTLRLSLEEAGSSSTMTEGVVFSALQFYFFMLLPLKRWCILEQS